MFAVVLSAFFSAFRASFGLVYQPFFSIEFLLSRSENKFVVAFFANQHFVFIHFKFYLSKDFAGGKWLKLYFDYFNRDAGEIFKK